MNDGDTFNCVFCLGKLKQNSTGKCSVCSCQWHHKCFKAYMKHNKKSSCPQCKLIITDYYTKKQYMKFHEDNQTEYLLYQMNKDFGIIGEDPPDFDSVRYYDN